MKRILIILAVLFCAAVPCRALDLILRNGETLYNVTNVTPLFSRVHMVTHPPDGVNGDWGIMIRTVRYRDLMPDSLQALQTYLVQRGRTLPANIYSPLKNGEQVIFTAQHEARSGTIGRLNGFALPVYIRGLHIPAGSIWRGHLKAEKGFFYRGGSALPVYSPKWVRKSRKYSFF